MVRWGCRYGPGRSGKRDSHIAEKLEQSQAQFAVKQGGLRKVRDYVTILKRNL